jgi:hypothetical protein
VDTYQVFLDEMSQIKREVVSRNLSEFHRNRAYYYINDKEVAARAALERLTSRGPHSSLSRAFRSLSHRIGKLCKAGESTVNCNLFRDMAKLKSINLDSIPEEDLKQIEYTWDKVVADLLRI